MKLIINNTFRFAYNLFKRCMVILSLLTISVLIFIFFSLATVQVNKDTLFLIPNQSRMRTVSRLLAEKKVISHQTTFHIFAKLYCKIYGKYIIAGEYRLKEGDNVFDIMNIITSGKVVQHSITIPEGFTVKQVIAKIRGRENVTHSPNLPIIKEGSLLPETYFYTHGTFDMTIVERMRNMMDTLISSEWPKRDKRIDSMVSSPVEVIILASIVEKETYINSEKPLIAGVYLNRLKKDMKLQADPTVIYGLNLFDNTQWKGRVLYSHLKSDSEYNTYRHKGLPPTPICNPGKASIMAVLHPKWTQKMFFVSIGNGRHIYAENFEQHKRNINTAKNSH